MAIFLDSTDIGIIGAIGLARNDVLIGAAGNDTMDCGASDDTLISGRGRDLRFGGAGIDLVDYANSLAAVAFNLATPVNSGGDT